MAIAIIAMTSLARQPLHMRERGLGTRLSYDLLRIIIILYNIVPAQSFSQAEGPYYAINTIGCMKQCHNYNALCIMSCNIIILYY